METVSEYIQDDELLEYYIENYYIDVLEQFIGWLNKSGFNKDTITSIFNEGIADYYLPTYYNSIA